MKRCSEGNLVGIWLIRGGWDRGVKKDKVTEVQRPQTLGGEWRTLEKTERLLGNLLSQVRSKFSPAWIPLSMRTPLELVPWVLRSGTHPWWGRRGRRAPKRTCSSWLGSLRRAAGTGVWAPGKTLLPSWVAADYSCLRELVTQGVFLDSSSLAVLPTVESSGNS